MNIAARIDDIEKIFISGSGQIGTSTAIDILSNMPNVKIAMQDVDASKEAEVYQSLRANKISDADMQRVSFSTNPATVKGAGMAIVAVPSEQLKGAVKFFAPHLDRDIIVIDTCSAKELAIGYMTEAMNEVKENDAPFAIDYVATHVFNGNKGGGPLTASSIHKNSAVFVIPDIGSPEAEKVVIELFDKLGSRIFQPSPQNHDRTAATTSFLTYVRAFAIMQTAFMQNLLQQSNMHDEGNLVQQMLRIADAGTGEIWLSNFKDGKVQIGKESANFLDVRRQLLDALERDCQSTEQKEVSAIINDYHNQAKVICGETERWQCNDFNIDKANKYSAFAASISGAVVGHFDYVQSQTGLPIALVANPSGKDSLKPMTLDPKISAELIARYAPDVLKMNRDFRDKFLNILAMIASDDRTGLQKIILESTERRLALAKVFEPLPNSPSDAIVTAQQKGALTICAKG